MPLSSFLGKFSRPSRITGPVAPTFDQDDRQLDILLGRTSPGGTRIERGTNPLMQMNAPMSRMGGRSEMRAPMTGNADGSPNVVYDAGTELAFKRFDEQKRQNREGERLREKQIESLAGLNEAKLGIQRGGLDIKSQQLQLQRFKAENPNMIVKQVPGGNFIAIDPQTGDVVDTGISSGRMDESAKIAAQGANRIDVANINQAGADERQRSANQSALERLLMQGDVNIQRDKNKFFNTPAKAPGASDVRGRAIELINARPELAPFINIDEEGKVTVLQPGANPGGLNLLQKGVKAASQLFSGETPDLTQQNTSTTLDEPTWREINMALYAPQRTGLEANPLIQRDLETSTKGAAEQNKQFTNMVTPDGRTIRVPSARVSEMLAKGAKVK